MRVILAAVVTLALLYMADQEFADGRYTLVILKMMRQIRHSMGF